MEISTQKLNKMLIKSQQSLINDLVDDKIEESLQNNDDFYIEELEKIIRLIIAFKNGISNSPMLNRNQRLEAVLNSYDSIVNQIKKIVNQRRN